MKKSIFTLSFLFIISICFSQIQKVAIISRWIDINDTFEEGIFFVRFLQKIVE